MVSSSPTKVAPLPSMRDEGKDVGSVQILAGSTNPAQGLPNGYAANAAPATTANSESIPNGSANSAETASEPSTSMSDDLSPQSANSFPQATEGKDEFVDAPQFTSSQQDQNTTRGTTGETANIPSGSRNGEAAIEEDSTISAGQDNLAAQKDQTDQHTHSHKAPRSTTSKRVAAVAAAELNDDVLVGTRVSEGHENFVTAYNMLTGIRVAVSRCTAKINRPLNDADFSVTDEIDFDLSGGGHSHSSKYIFQFKDYAPWVFRHLRDVFRLDPADYLMSLTAKYIVSELGSPGKSGSFFYYSRDYRFIIKTIRHSEHKLLRRILKQYYSHVRSNPDTLISQFYGLHRVKLPFGRKIHFVVMNNVFPALYEIHERYDLKGSLLGREYHPDLSKPITVYKDLDWLRRHRRIVLGPEKRERLVRQLELDCKFLKRVNVMDYSLLIGIHDMTKGNAALKSLLKLEEFGPKDEKVSELEKRDATAAINKHGGKSANKPGVQRSLTTSGDRSRTAQKDFADLQTLLKKATPGKLKEFDFADEYRSEYYFYRDHGGFQSTNDQNEDLDVIYYVGVIDFLTGYTFRKSVETFCKSLIHDRKELSAVPAGEYGDRFLKFLRGCIGPAIPSTKPQKRVTDESRLQPETNKSEDRQAAQTNDVSSQIPFPNVESVKAHRTLSEPSEPTSTDTASSEPSSSELTSSQPSSFHSNLSSFSGPSTSTQTPPISVATMKASPSDTITAVTSKEPNGKTKAKPSSPVPEASRRPSVAGYGLDAVRVGEN